MVIPATDDNKANWIHAVGNDSYGLVAQYRDSAGRTWRSEMGLAADPPLRLDLIEGGVDALGTGEEE
jgi:hypothetical protein